MLNSLIEQYGAIAVFLGAGLEGETAAFLGGIIAHRHLAPFWQVVVAAGLGSFFADQILFMMGRCARNRAFVRRAIASPLMVRVTHLLDTHPNGFIPSFRFIYGMRTISPIAVGLSNIPIAQFMSLNAIAAAIWGLVIPSVGFLAGNAVEALFGRLHLQLHLLIGVGIAVLFAIVVAAYAWRRIMLSGTHNASR